MPNTTCEIAALRPVVLRPPEAAAYVGMKKTHMYYETKKGKFPRPIKLGDGARGFLVSELDAYLAQRTAERDQEAAKEKAA